MTDKSEAKSGDCVMTATAPFSSAEECSECKRTSQAKVRGYKFCPYCGAEIIRFDQAASERTIEVTVITEPRPVKRVIVDCIVEGGGQ